MASKKASKKAALPKGFKAITGGGNSWDFRSEKVLRGTLRNFKTIDSQYKETDGPNRGKPKKQNLAIIQREDGTEVAVFESAGLRPLFAQKKGTKVYLRFDGMLKIKGRKEPMKDFTVAVAGK